MGWGHITPTYYCKCRGKHDHRLNYQNVTHKIHSIGRRRFLKRARLTRLRHFIFFLF